MKACKKLHVTQSTLSTQLKNLEEYFDKKLFDRKVRKLILNDSGKIVYDYAKKIFSMSDELVESIKQHKVKKVITVSIGAVSTLPKSYVHEFTLPLWKNKNVIVRTKDAQLAPLLRELEMGLIDIILSDMKATTIGKKIENYKLTSRKIIAVSHERFANKDKPFPQILDKLPFINYSEDTTVRGEIDHFLKENKISPEIIGEVDDINLLKITAQKGLCFIIVPENAVNDSLKEKKLIKLGVLNSVETGAWAITRVKSETPEVVINSIKRFINLH